MNAFFENIYLRVPSTHHLIYEHHLSKTQKFFFFKNIYLRVTRVPSPFLTPSMHHCIAAPGLRPGPARPARRDVYPRCRLNIVRAHFYHEYHLSKTQKIFFFKNIYLQVYLDQNRHVSVRYFTISGSRNKINNVALF